jgi:hypothetical protein
MSARRTPPRLFCCNCTPTTPTSTRTPSPAMPGLATTCPCASSTKSCRLDASSICAPIPPTRTRANGACAATMTRAAQSVPMATASSRTALILNVADTNGSVPALARTGPLPSWNCPMASIRHRSAPIRGPNTLTAKSSTSESASRTAPSDWYVTCLWEAPSGNDCTTERAMQWKAAMQHLNDGD